jgi:ParB family chromosome partitioning protein
MRFELDALTMPSAVAGGAGTPLQLPLDAIDEDPSQPRKEYDPETLQQLADTIVDRGVRQAVSVRSHPDAPGRWMLNFGSRRLRASRLAGKTEIPAFIDETADSYDQVIENEQREGLKPIELALFIERELASGLNQAEVARRLGKSRTYIGYVCALIDPPDWLLSLYREGRCRGVKELHDLRRLGEKHLAQVRDFVNAHAYLSRGDVDRLRIQFESNGLSSVGPAAASTRDIEDAARVESPPASSVGLRTQSASRVPAARGAAIGPSLSLIADHDGAPMRIVMDQSPDDPELVFAHRGDDAERLTLKIDALTSLRLVRGTSASG